MVATLAVEQPAGPVRTERPLTLREIALFERDGFVVLPGFFSKEEVEPLRQACLADPTIGGRLRAVADSEGNAQEVIGWSADSDDYLGMVHRIARFIDNAETLLGKPVYHWHSKLSMKQPHAPGRWDWHQDYPYWYKEGCLYPDMLTASVAIDRCFLGNGCLQLVPGSHRLGRVDHMQVGQSVGFDPERLALVLKRTPPVPIELEPGDAVFFHGNTLHASGGNQSDSPRTILHCSYNTIDNSPFVAEGQEHHTYKPFEKLPDDVLRKHTWRSIFDNHTFWPRRGATSNPYGYKVVTLQRS